MNSAVKPLILFFLIAAPLFGYKWEANRQITNLSRLLYFYEDPSATLSFDQILENEDSVFAKNRESYPAFGFTKSAIWGKFTLNNTTKEIVRQYLVFDYVLLDRIDIYIPEKNGQYRQVVTGNSFAFQERGFSHRKFIQPLELSPGNNTIYIRAFSKDTLELPLRVMNKDGLFQTNERESWIVGLYYGILLVMCVYNFFVFLSVRDLSYLYYVLYIIGFAHFQLGADGLLNQFFENTEGDVIQKYRILMSVFGMISVALFAIQFLNIKKRLQKIYKIFMGLIFTTPAIVVLVFIDVYYALQMIFVFLFIGTILTMVAAILLSKDYRPARFFLAAWTFFLLAVFVFSMKLFHVYIPWFTVNAMQLGSALEVTTLSLALAFRLRLLSEERERLLADSLETEQKLLESDYKINLLDHRLHSLDLQNRLFESELEVAREIQMNLIPRSKPEENIAVLYLPIEKIGGDFMDLLFLDEDTIGIFISDVSGHGIPAALLTIMLKAQVSNLRSNRHSGGQSLLYDPGKLFAYMNEAVRPFTNGNFISAFYGVFNKRTKEFRYSGASHPPPLLFEKNEKGMDLLFLDMPKQFPPLGVFGADFFYDTESRVFVRQCTPGSKLFFYSDGLMDAVGYTYENIENPLLSFKGTILYDIFSGVDGENSEDILKDVIIQLLEEKRDAIEDDVCALCIGV